MAQQLAGEAPQRWSAKRKAEVVNAIAKGDITKEAAHELYGLSEPELTSWQDSLHSHGVAGLRLYAPERRKDARRRVREPAVAMFSSSRIKCVIKDIAEGGARVEFSSTRLPPRTFVLQCERSNRASWVTVIWRKDRQVGLRFDPAPPIDATTGSVSGPWLLGEE